ncbi:Ankyrin repeat domain-containing protein 39 [Sparganum proliferum]
MPHHEHQQHQCACVQPSPLSQTLDELEFERGIWSCAVYGDIRKLSSLLSSGTPVNAQDNYGYVALHYAARNGHLEVCKTLLEHGADAYIATKSLKATALHRAAYSGHLDVVKLLAQINTPGRSPLVLLRDTDGESCLHSAARGRQKDVYDWLAEKFPELVPLRNNAGKTAEEVYFLSEARSTLSS